MEEEAVIEPVAEQAPEQAPVEQAKSAVERALDAVGWSDDDAPAEPKAEPKTEAKPETTARDEKGRFKANADQPGEGETEQPEAANAKPEAEEKAYRGPEAPSRFSADAKAVWANTPKAVKAEVDRLAREAETLASERQATGDIAQYAKMAAENGRTLKDVIENYWTTEQALMRDPVNTLLSLGQRLGVDLRQALSGQPEAPQSDLARQNAALMQKVAQLEQGVNGIQQTWQQNQRAAQTQQYVEQFAAKSERFEELSEQIVEHIKSGLTLETAYRLAAAENPPAPKPAPEADPAAAQTRKKAALSVSGAPATGNGPSTHNRKPTSTRAAVQSAFSRVGI